MAHVNEFRFLQRFLADWPVGVEGAVLNLGTAEHGPINPYAELFPGRTVVGLDQQAGPAVDVVCDLTDADAVARTLAGRTFAAVLCCSVLEHCRRPWLAAAAIRSVLAPRGLLYVTVPWIWRRHAYPDDYWRISDAGVRELFPDVSWKRLAYLTQAPDEIVPPADADGHPWRIEHRRGRIYLASQLLCMIGRIP